jgi:hypothetical protein
MIADKPIDQITAADLVRLISNGVAEDRTLEYKEALPRGSDQDKREFLADVSSFANAVGGDLVYGVRERRDAGKATGTPEEVVGVDVASIDQEVLRLENILRDGIAPRIPGIRFRPIVGFSRGAAVVVRVPRSWAAPHMVAFQASGKFFTRHSGGKHQLDVLELRDAFLNSSSASERAEEFRTARLGRLVGGGAPVQLSSEKLLCLHAVPHGALFGAVAVDIQKAAGRNVDLQPIAASAWGRRFNIDGVISVASTGSEGNSTGYVQVFRNGAVEVVHSEIVFDLSEFSSGKGLGIGAGDIAKGLFAAVDRLQRILRTLDVGPPVSVFVSLHGVKEVALCVSRRLRLSDRSVFDRDTILLPEISLVSLDSSTPDVLKPVMDALWQAAGHARCFDYDDGGQWAPQQ